MSKKSDFNWQAPRGTHDRLPEIEPLWRLLTSVLEKRADGFGYKKIETPIFEYEPVFARAIGDSTDIVEKEMFEVRRMSDLNEADREQRLVLRPEGTAGVVRAYLEHGMHTWPQPVKLWYLGPFFRAERPQKGRYREFYQAGFEIFGDDDPATDALLIYLFWQILGDLKIRDQLIVDVNSMGCQTCRPKYRKLLLSYYESVDDKICATCQLRKEKNPLRLLDCKEEGCVQLRQNAPQIIDNLCGSCRDHFKSVLEALDELNIIYNLNPALVRGFDYYTRTTFEVRSMDDERSQNALGGGGRYDRLVEQFGGKSTPAVGFAIGLNRIIELMQKMEVEGTESKHPDLFVIQLGERARRACLQMVASLGDEGFSALCNPGKDSLKSQLRLADKSGARYAVIIGQREALDNTVIIRDMDESTQETVDQKDFSAILIERLERPRSKRKIERQLDEGD